MNNDRNDQPVGDQANKPALGQFDKQQGADENAGQDKEALVETEGKQQGDNQDQSIKVQGDNHDR